MGIDGCRHVDLNAFDEVFVGLDVGVATDFHKRFVSESLQEGLSDVWVVGRP